MNRKRSRNAHPLLDIQLPQFVSPSFQSPKTHFAAKPDIELYWYTTNVLYYTMSWGLPDTHQSDPIAALSNPESLTPVRLAPQQNYDSPIIACNVVRDSAMHLVSLLSALG